MNTTSSGLTFTSCDFTTDKRSNTDRLLSKTIEQQPARLGGSTIKAKHKFIQIIIQMSGRGLALMSTQQPSFQQRSHAISQRQQVFTNLSRFTNNRMLITRTRQLTVAFPAVGTDFAFRLDAFFDRRNQTISRSIFEFMQTDSSRMVVFILNRYEHKCFTESASTPFARTRPQRLRTNNLRTGRRVVRE